MDFHVLITMVKCSSRHRSTYGQLLSPFGSCALPCTTTHFITTTGGNF